MPSYFRTSGAIVTLALTHRSCKCGGVDKRVPAATLVVLDHGRCLCCGTHDHA